MEKLTTNWKRCPHCGAPTLPTGNPIVCLKCGGGIVRMIGRRRLAK